jgi:hypothetical protein
MNSTTCWLPYFMVLVTVPWFLVLIFLWHKSCSSRRMRKYIYNTALGERGDWPTLCPGRFMREVIGQIYVPVYLWERWLAKFMSRQIYERDDRPTLCSGRFMREVTGQLYLLADLWERWLTNFMSRHIYERGDWPNLSRQIYERGDWPTLCPSRFMREVTGQIYVPADLWERWLANFISQPIYERGDWPTLCPGRFIPGKEPGCVWLRAVLNLFEEMNSLPLTGIKPLIV